MQDDAANVEDLAAGEHDKMDSLEEEEGGAENKDASTSAADKKTGKQREGAEEEGAGPGSDDKADSAKDQKSKKKGKQEGEAEEEGSDKSSASKKDDDDDGDGKPESGSGGTAVASGQSSTQSTGKVSGSSGGQTSGSGGSNGKQSQKGGEHNDKKRQHASHAENHKSVEPSSVSRLAQAAESASAAGSTSSSAESAPTSTHQSRSRLASQADQASPSTDSAPAQEAESTSRSTPDAPQHSGSAETSLEQAAPGSAKSSEAKPESAHTSASIQHPASLSRPNAESVSETADDADSDPATGVSTSSSQGILAPTDAKAVESINTSLHPAASELTRTLDAQLHPELARVASDMSDTHTVSAAPALAQAAAEFNREADSAESADSSPHAFGMGDLARFKDDSLTQEMEEPLQAEDLPSKARAKRASAHPQSSVSATQGAADVDEPPNEPSHPPDLEGLLGDTVGNIGTDPRYADVLTRAGDPKDVDSKHGAKAPAALSNQVLPDVSWEYTPHAYCVKWGSVKLCNAASNWAFLPSEWAAWGLQPLPFIVSISLASSQPKIICPPLPHLTPPKGARAGTCSWTRANAHPTPPLPPIPYPS